MRTIATQMNTAELLDYREFDRVAKPALCIPFVQSYNVAEVVEWMGTTDNITPLELSIFNNTALLTDGNHRIAAANILGIATVPVIVTYYETIEELSAVFYPHTIERFKTVK